MSTGLLQLIVLRHHVRSDETAAVCPECSCTFGVGHSTVQPHHTNATGAALASGSTSGGLQDGPGLPVTVRHGSSLCGRRLSVIGLRRRSSSAAFYHIKHVCCETNIIATMESLRQVFCSCISDTINRIIAILNALSGYSWLHKLGFFRDHYLVNGDSDSETVVTRLCGKMGSLNTLVIRFQASLSTDFYL